MSSESSEGLASFSASALFDVRGLIAVVTGGSSGLGLYAAQALASNGALVYILGRRSDRLATAVSTFHALLPDAAQRHSGDMVAIQADITSKSSLSAARDQISTDLASRGRAGINILVCNAGIGGRFLRSYGTDQEGKEDEFETIVDELWSFSEQECNDILNTNVTGNYLTALAFLPLLKAATTDAYNSQTILISSNAAWAKLPILNPMYNISKTAVSQLGHMLSTMFATHSLRTNILEPGLYPSEMTSTEATDPTTGHKTLSHTNGADIPLGRCGHPREHAAAVLYLAARASNFANGTTMRVDGGALQRIPASD